MSERRMFKYTVPVDDEPHGYDLTGDPVMAAAVDQGKTVEFWAEHTNGIERRRLFQIFGTGQPLPEGAEWFGTTQRLGPTGVPLAMGLVWHLYEVHGD
jgi:hypothetical protein